MTNCIVSGNYLGVKSERGSSPTLNNCTVSGNLWGAGVDFYEGSATLNNCIVWGNANLMEAVSNLTVSHSCIQSTKVWPGEGNINADPQF